MISNLTHLRRISHLLLGLLREEKGIAAQVLNSLGVTLDEAREDTLKILGSDAAPSEPAGIGGGGPASPENKGDKKSKTPALDHFCRDLTELARQDKLDPIEGQPPDLADLPPGCSFLPRCRYAIDRCAVESPPLTAVQGAHMSACWVADQLPSETARTS